MFFFASACARPILNRQTAVLSKALHPIYFLFVAPPAAAAIAWKGMSGEFDVLAKSLYFIAGFLYVFFVLGNSTFLRTASFSIAWWAYSFPCETDPSPATWRCMCWCVGYQKDIHVGSHRSAQREYIGSFVLARCTVSYERAC